ncbi:hypothetical protein VTK56DRAFT_5009 [Thermocarpiscus australiensis]
MPTPLTPPPCLRSDSCYRALQVAQNMPDRRDSVFSRWQGAVSLVLQCCAADLVEAVFRTVVVLRKFRVAARLPLTFFSSLSQPAAKPKNQAFAFTQLSSFELLNLKQLSRDPELELLGRQHLDTDTTGKHKVTLLHVHALFPTTYYNYTTIPI